MSPAAWRYAAAALPLLPIGAVAVERIPVPVEEAAKAEAPAQPSSSVPDWLRQLGIESWWDVVQVDPWTASLGLSFDDQQQRLTSTGGATLTRRPMAQKTSFAPNCN